MMLFLKLLKQSWLYCLNYCAMESAEPQGMGGVPESTQEVLVFRV